MALPLHHLLLRINLYFYSYAVQFGLLLCIGTEGTSYTESANSNAAVDNAIIQTAMEAIRAQPSVQSGSNGASGAAQAAGERVLYLVCCGVLCFLLGGWLIITFTKICVYSIYSLVYCSIISSASCFAVHFLISTFSFKITYICISCRRASCNEHYYGSHQHRHFRCRCGCNGYYHRRCSDGKKVRYHLVFICLFVGWVALFSYYYL